MNPIQRKARIAGLWYLSVTLTGIWTLMVAPSKLFVHGDAAATVQRMLGSEMLFRSYMAVCLISSLCFLMLALALYELFKDVDRGLSRLMLALVAIQIPCAWVVAVAQAMALELAKGGSFMEVFAGPQREALAMLFLRLDHHGTMASQLLWGLWLFPLAALVLRSRYQPRFLGWCSTSMASLMWRSGRSPAWRPSTSIGLTTSCSPFSWAKWPSCSGCSSEARRLRRRRELNPAKGREEKQEGPRMESFAVLRF